MNSSFHASKQATKFQLNHLNEKPNIGIVGRIRKIGDFRPISLCLTNGKHTDTGTMEA